MDFSFSMFEPRKLRKQTNTDPVVQIRPNGRIVFNQTATELLNSHHYCMLGYDQQQNAIGILPLQEEKVNAFPIRYASKGAYVGAKKFFQHFNILPAASVENNPVQANSYIGIKL